MGKAAELKVRTDEQTKQRARQVYARWNINLNDAINIFLVKSIEVGGLPFDMRRDAGLPFDELAKTAYKPELDGSGIAVLPAEWDEGEDDADYEGYLPR